MSAMSWYQLTHAGVVTLADASKSQDKLSASQQVNTLSLLNLPAPAHRGMAYGDGFFTTMGVYDAQILWQNYHDARLNTHAQALHLYLPLSQRQTLWQAVAAFADEIKHGIIKIIISRQVQTVRGYGHATNLVDNACTIHIGVMTTAPLAKQTTVLTLGIATSQDANNFQAINAAQDIDTIQDINSAQNTDTAKDIDTTQDISAVQRSHTPTQVMLQATQCSIINPTACPILQQPAVTAVCLQSQLAGMPRPIAGLKTLNRLDSVLIAGELERHKIHNEHIGEGLVQDMTGRWIEGVMSNLFYQLAGNTQWYTPPIESSGVRGAMRQVIVDKFVNTATPIQLKALYDKDLEDITALFFCNAVRGVMPVDKLILPSGQMIALNTFIK